MKRVASAFLLVSLVLSVLSLADETSPVLRLHDNTPGLWALTNARVVVSPTRTIDNATIVINEGLIIEIGENAQTPPGSRVLDLSGKTVYAGFIDPFAQYGLSTESRRSRGRSRGPQYTTERIGGNAWNEAVHAEQDWFESFAPDSENAAAYHSIGYTTVQTGSTDGIFRGRSVVVQLGNELPNDEIIRPRSMHWLSFRKGSSGQDYPSSLMGAIALIRQTFYDVDWYQRVHEARSRNPQLPLPEFNAPIEALATAEGEAMLIEAGSDMNVVRASRIADEFERDFVFVGSGYEYRRLDQLSSIETPIILPLDFPEPPEVSTLEDELDVTLAELRHWERAPYNAIAVAEAGIPIAFSSHKHKKKATFLSNLKKVVKLGLSPETALAAVTTIPAEICGIDDYLGTVEKGKSATFIICDGDIFNPETSVQSVWISGKPHELKPLDPPDLRGLYEFSMSSLSGQMSITGEQSAPEVQMVIGEDTISGSGVAVQRGRIDFSVEFPDSLYSGVTRLSGRLTDGVLSGNAALPGGDWINWSADFLAPPEEVVDSTDTDDEKVDQPDRQELISKLTSPNRSYGSTALPPVEDVLLKNGIVWTSDKDGVLQNTDILVKDGKIAEIGKDLQSGDARVIDLAGKHVSPGLIDEHSHICIDGDVNEGTHAVTAEVRIEDVIDPDDINMYRQLAGGTTASRLLHGSANPIGGQAAVIKLRWGADDKELLIADADPGIKFALGENVKQSNWGERFRTRYPQTRLGVEAIIRDAVVAARQYGADWSEFQALSDRTQSTTIPPRRNLKLEALVEVLNQQRFITCHGYVANEMLRLLRLGEEFGFTVRTFGHGLECYKIADELVAAGTGVGSFSDWWAYKFEVYDAIPQSPGLMMRKGVLVSINSDSPETARRLNQEAAKSIMYTGLEPEEALKMVTINPAQQLGIDHRCGSITVGKDADFVIWNGNPLSIYSKPEQTWVEGRRLFDIESDSIMRDEIRDEKHKLIQKVLTEANGNSGGKGRRGSSRGGYKPPDTGQSDDADTERGQS